MAPTYFCQQIFFYPCSALFLHVGHKSERHRLGFKSALTVVAQLILPAKMCQLLLQVVLQQANHIKPSSLPSITPSIFHNHFPSNIHLTIHSSINAFEWKGLSCKNKRTRVVCIEEIQVAVESAGAAALGRAGVKEVWDGMRQDQA